MLLRGSLDTSCMAHTLQLAVSVSWTRHQLAHFPGTIPCVILRNVKLLKRKSKYFYMPLRVHILHFWHHSDVRTLTRHTTLYSLIKTFSISDPRALYKISRKNQIFHICSQCLLSDASHSCHRLICVSSPLTCYRVSLTDDKLPTAVYKFITIKVTHNEMSHF